MSQKEITRALNHLRKDVRTLQDDFLSFQEDRLDALNSEGFPSPGAWNCSSKSHPTPPLPGPFSPLRETCFYELFQKYSFRLFLREILIRKGHFRIADVVRFSNLKRGANTSGP